MASRTSTTAVVAAAGSNPDPPPFDAEAMDAAPSLKERLLDWVFSKPGRVLLVFRVFQAFAWFSGWHFIVRYDEVREAFQHDKELPVDWGAKMKQVTTGQGYAGRNFVLGMARGAEYSTCYRQLAEAFPVADVPRYFVGASIKQTELILDEVKNFPPTASGHIEFDAIQDLIHAVPTRLCGEYFGIPIPESERVDFAKWTLATSAFVFGASEPDEKGLELAMAGSERLRDAIDKGIKQADQEIKQGIEEPYTAIRQMRSKNIGKDDVLAQMFGMVLGFIPTNVLAGGNMLETLFRYPAFLQRARAAAQAGDDELLWRCLRETLRFRNINPAMWRHSPQGYVFSTGRRIPPGAKRVFVSAQTAMFDAARVERPHVFDPGRRDDDYMIFGVGQHWCIGAYIAKAQLTQTFKPLLQLKELKAVDGSARTGRYGAIFPMHLQVSFKP